MLRIEWNSLRIGDEVLAHDPRDTELALIRGVVAMIDTKKDANGVDIRVGTGDGHQVLWPPYLTVHRDPPDPSEPCWRCEAISQGRESRYVDGPTRDTAAMDPVASVASPHSAGRTP